MSESACGDGERNGQLFLCIITTQLVVLTEVVGVYTGK